MGILISYAIKGLKLKHSWEMWYYLIHKKTAENFRPCLVGRKFSVFSIQTFRKQGKHVYLRKLEKNKF